MLRERIDSSLHQQRAPRARHRAARSEPRHGARLRARKETFDPRHTHEAVSANRRDVDNTRARGIATSASGDRAKMSTSAMLPSMALASTASFAGPRRSALRGRAVVPRAVSDNAKDDVASSSGTPSRRGVLFGSLAATIALPAVAATKAKPMSPVDAFITLMDGRGRADRGDGAEGHGGGGGAARPGARLPDTATRRRR